MGPLPTKEEGQRKNVAIDGEWVGEQMELWVFWGIFCSFFPFNFGSGWWCLWREDKNPPYYFFVLFLCCPAWYFPSLPQEKWPRRYRKSKRKEIFCFLFLFCLLLLSDLSLPFSFFLRLVSPALVLEIRFLLLKTISSCHEAWYCVEA